MANSCNGCGLCCKLFYINLSEKEYRTGKYQTELQKFGEIKSFRLAKESGANILAKKQNGDCIYLVDNQCSIHETRPGVCRDFFCTSRAKKFQNMVEIIKKADTEEISSVKLLT